MNERWFEEFAEVLDKLYSIMRNSDDDVERLIEDPYDELAAVYEDIKAEYGYTDASDEE